MGWWPTIATRQLLILFLHDLTFLHQYQLIWFKEFEFWVVITKVGKSLSIIPPTEPNTSSGNDDLSILWLSPDEWMVYSNEKSNPNNFMIRVGANIEIGCRFHLSEKDYPNLMGSYKDILSLSEIDSLVEFIKKQK